MSTVAQRLRALANELDSGGFPTGPVLVPVVAREVKVGDVLTETVGERLTVAEIVVDHQMVRGSDGTTPMLKLKGRVVTELMPDGYESGHAVWANGYVVVER